MRGSAPIQILSTLSILLSPIRPLPVRLAASGLFRSGYCIPVKGTTNPAFAAAVMVAVCGGSRARILALCMHTRRRKP